MPHYMITVSYTAEAMASMIKNPQDRAAALTPAVEAAGGKLEAFYFAFGEDDAFAIIEAPDNVSAAAYAMAVAAGGHASSARTTVLMTTEEAQQAMAKASTTGFKAPS